MAARGCAGAALGASGRILKRFLILAAVQGERPGWARGTRLELRARGALVYAAERR